MPSVPVGRDANRIGWHLPASGTETDISVPAYEAAWPRLPLTYGVDPRFPGVWRKLPGWRHITTDETNMRIRGDEVGLSITSDVTIEFFKPVVLKYGSEAHERRGFVVSANNILIFKYWNTKTTTWSSKILDDDLLTHFGSRTDFDVTTIGKFLYVSRGYTEGANSDFLNTSAKVYWWDDNRLRWRNVGGGVRGPSHSRAIPSVQTVLAFDGPGGGIYVGGFFGSVGGLEQTGSTRETVSGFAHLDPTTGVWTAIGVFEGVISSLSQITEAGVTYVIIGGWFPVVRDSVGAVIANATYLASYNPLTGLLSAVGGSVNGPVLGMTTDSGGNLIIGGEFTRVNNATPITSNRVARYNIGVGWDSSFGNPGIANGSVYGVGHNGSTYWAVGSFSSPVTNIAQSTGSGTWTAGVSGAAVDGTVRAVEFVNSKIYVAGEFTGYTGNPNTLPKIAEISTNAFVNPWAHTVLDGDIWCMESGDTDTLFVGGDFSVLTGATSTYTGIAKFDVTQAATDPVPLSTGDLEGDPTLGFIRIMDMDWGDWSGGLIASSKMEGLLIAGGVSKAGLDDGAAGLALWTPGSSDNFYSAHMPSNDKKVMLPELSVSTSKPVGGSLHEAWRSVAQFKGDNYSYAFFVRFVDHNRGYTGLPSEVITFKVEENTDLVRGFVTVTDFGVASERPTSLQVWRSQGVAPLGGVDFAPVGGPFYLELEIPIDPQSLDIESTESNTTTFMMGTLSDETLAQGAPFDPLYDLTGARKSGPAIGATKGCLVSVAAGDAPNDSNEAFYDARWSPPWTHLSPPYRRVEGTSFQGSHRTRITQNNETPRLIEVGDFLVFASNAGLTRFQKQGDYLSVLDGPIGVGVLNRQAMEAVGGDLWFISSGGDMMRMNVATGGLQTLHQFSRLLRTRWRNYVRDRQMSIAYDPRSQMLVVGPVLE